jgi:hypothetical protein
VSVISVSNSAYIQKYFWENAGFGKVKHIPELEKEVATFHVRRQTFIAPP